ncbi:hypothetical protein SH139x_000830 [Planctomycetaceae bacterium SH139]
MMRICVLTAAVIWMTFSAGCSEGGDRSTASGLTVVVQYKQQPIADVHVMLHAQAGGPVVLEGWTKIDGTAELRVPAESSFSPDPAAIESLEFLVATDSISDGGWSIQAKYTDPARSGLTVSFEVGQTQATLELPANAVKPL